MVVTMWHGCEVVGEVLAHWSRKALSPMTTLKKQLKKQLTKKKM